MIKPLFLAALAAPLFVAGCATPENRVRSALLQAGVSRPVAGCMADRMVDRLSYSQLNRLASLGKLQGRRVESMSIGELLRNLRSLGDPEIVRVVTSAGVGCAIAS